MQIHGSGFGAWDSVFLRSSLGDSEVGNPWVTHWESYLENSSLELVCFPCFIHCLISYWSSPFIQIPLCQWICGKFWSLTVIRLINSDTSPCHFQRYPVNISRGARGIRWGVKVDRSGREGKSWLESSRCWRGNEIWSWELGLLDSHHWKDQPCSTPCIAAKKKKKSRIYSTWAQTMGSQGCFLSGSKLYLALPQAPPPCSTASLPNLLGWPPGEKSEYCCWWISRR